MSLLLYALPDVSFTWMVVLFFILTAFESPPICARRRATTDLCRAPRVRRGLERIAVRLGGSAPCSVRRSPARSCMPPVRKDCCCRGRLLSGGRRVHPLSRPAAPRQDARGAERLRRRAAHPGTYGRAGLDPRGEYKPHPPSPSEKLVTSSDPMAGLARCGGRAAGV